MGSALNAGGSAFLPLTALKLRASAYRTPPRFGRSQRIM